MRKSVARGEKLLIRAKKDFRKIGNATKVFFRKQ
jgi:hypothetical protein